MKMRIKSQLYSDAEAQKKVGAILDDCGPSSAAAAVAYVNNYAPDLQASDGVAAKARATGFTEKQGVSDNLRLHHPPLNFRIQNQHYHHRHLQPPLALR